MIEFVRGEKAKVIRAGNENGADKLVGLVGVVGEAFHPRYHLYFPRKDVPTELLLWAGDPVGPYTFNIAQLQKLPKEKIVDYDDYIKC